MTTGCPRTSTAEIAYPVEVDYAHDEVPDGLFAGEPARSAGLDRWTPLLPPLDAPTLGEGGTPLIEIGDGAYLKDESRNPTWSHKDRLNRCTVSAAVRMDAPGVVVASSGNHGASAAAFAARAGLRCIVLTSPDAPPAVRSFVDSYGAVVLPLPQESRWPLMRQITDRLGYHPVSNLTVTHTGHAFGPEGYKTIAYEIFTEIGVPAAVFTPTGYGELLFGVWKGFAELRRLGLACSVGGHRGLVAIPESGGEALPVSDEEMAAAQAELSRQGVWAELSAAAGLAGLRRHGAVDGPVVCVSTSSGFKDLTVGSHRAEPIDPTWEAVSRRLRAAGITA
ncbi:pyridoxal-phosphate dependent enzyme [Planomonospora corallina]|uniref:Pyridoxal-phosphate dependent enzyme n=1 Tax=Planomonospora corallina TaxID=1806052 RepID=A0ABV8I790_9ACTN